MRIKSLKSKVGKLHYLRFKRILKHPTGKFRKQDVQIIIANDDLKELYDTLHTIYGDGEHFLAVPVKEVKEILEEKEREEIIKNTEVPLFGLT